MESSIDHDASAPPTTVPQPPNRISVVTHKFGQYRGRPRPTWRGTIQTAFYGPHMKPCERDASIPVDPRAPRSRFPQALLQRRSCVSKVPQSHLRFSSAINDIQYKIFELFWTSFRTMIVATPKGAWMSTTRRQASQTVRRVGESPGAWNSVPVEFGKSMPKIISADCNHLNCERRTCTEPCDKRNLLRRAAGLRYPEVFSAKRLIST